MADNKNQPDFIEGIYNYCDYICEKCLTGCDDCEWSGKCKKCHEG